MNIEKEITLRVEWIKTVLNNACAKGIVIGNSGGKDCTLVEILCKMATPNVLSIIMPCESKRNYTIDREHALAVATQYNIETVEIDISSAKIALADAVKAVVGNAVPMAYSNMNPRLRMATLYSVGQAKGYLVAGTGNASEIYMGYFTKWGDGAFDFNPISDLNSEEIFDFLRFLNAPAEIIEKEPSAGLYEGQTDEKEMGVSYKNINLHMKGKKNEDSDKIIKAHCSTQHKRVPSLKYPIL